MVMNNTTYAQLCANMEQLKLTQMLLHLDEITDFVTANNLSFTEGLLKLSNYEVDFKEKNASRSMIKAAAFPFVKELKDYGVMRFAERLKQMGLPVEPVYTFDQAVEALTKLRGGMAHA